eukprot:c6312_g1_i1 orf=1-396(-)
MGTFFLDHLFTGGGSLSSRVVEGSATLSPISSTPHSPMHSRYNAFPGFLNPPYSILLPLSLPFLPIPLTATRSPLSFPSLLVPLSMHIFVLLVLLRGGRPLPIGAWSMADNRSQLPCPQNYSFSHRNQPSSC